MSKNGLEGLAANNAAARLVQFVFSAQVTDWEHGVSTAAVVGRALFSRPVSFMFVAFPGLVVMLVIGYIPVFLPGKIDPKKTDGLTLLTLNRGK